MATTLSSASLSLSPKYCLVGVREQPTLPFLCVETTALATVSILVPQTIFNTA